MKRCSKCGVERKEGEFHASSVTLDKLQAWCRACKSGCPPSPPARYVLGTEKQCTRCAVFKCGLDFALKKADDPSYGLQAWCKACAAAYQRQRHNEKKISTIVWDRQQREQVKQDRYEALKTI